MAVKEAMESLYSYYINLAVDSGALEAKVILASSIKTASWTRFKCQYGCPNYNTNLCCPPYTPTAEETQKAIDDYSHALLLKFRTIADVKKAIPEIERAILLDGKYKAFGFKAGSCGLCEKCNLKNCTHPAQARPTMEASGIDVYETVRRNGFSVEVLQNKESQGSFFGLILIE